MKFKVTALLLIIACILAPFGRQTIQADPVSAYSYTVTDYKIIKGNTAQINPNDEITLRLNIKNNSTATPGSSLSLQIEDSSSFYGKNSNIFDVKAAVSDISASTFSVDIPLVYSGSGKKLTLSFLADGTKVSKQSVTVDLAVPTVPEASPTPAPIPVDTSKYVPRLSVTGGDIPTGEAGSTMQLVLPIKNTSPYAASNITVTLDPGEAGKIPFEPGMANLVQTLGWVNPGETKAVSFALKLRSDAQAGVYTMKLNYTFNNGSGDSFTASESLYLKVNNNNVPVRISLAGISNYPQEAIPGQKLKLTVRVSNDGSFKASGVRVSLTGLKSDGFALDGDTGSRYISSLFGGAVQEVVFNLVASSGLTGGSQPLGVKLDYKDDGGTAVSDESTVFIPVRQTEGASPAAVVIDKLTGPDSVMLPNDKFTVGFRVVNGGGVKAQNVKVSVTTDKELIPVTLSNVILPTLAPGKSKDLSFKLSVAPDAVTRNYPVSITVEYDVMQNGQAVKNTLQQYVGVYVQGKPASGSPDGLKTVPRIIVSQYAINPSQVPAGKEAAVDVTLLNTSRMMNVGNIKLTVMSEDGTFTVDGSNTFYIDSLPSGASLQKKLTVRAKPDAEAKVYALSLNLEYEDAKGNPFTSKETVSLPVVQENRLTAGEVTVGGEAYVGQPVPLSLDFYNMGKAILYNLMVTVEGDGFQSANGSYYVGNFASGRSDSFQPSITANAAGELSGNVVFAFEDASGNRSEIRKPFTVNVMEMPQMPDPSGQMPEQPLEGGSQSKLRQYWIYGAVALVAIAGVVTGLKLRSRRRRRKELELDDDF
ncbi:COG1361 S-layer family protein [Paenibacillus sp. NFR01]|uniref:COG1361 S-layer family protein n=1 Tax=Paenibacillus sp. NFR01 TaxID=1566279 RepID=UPI0008AAFB9D|nr:CARDB domain-containing protein [Paenibacillus sp. NFR01]SET98909.1 Uncharacterized conserved protein [Paenibacillus sp. NFR01]